MALPYQALKKLTEGDTPVIRSSAGFSEKQIQPASLDLTLGTRVHRVSASFLPRENETVADLLQRRTLYDFELKPGTILETNTSYIIPLQESLALPADISGMANPKSSIGRVDVFVRLLTDKNSQYDFVPAGYHGPLYLEIIPLTFAIRVAPGLPMTQIRLRHVNERPPTVDELLALQTSEGIVFHQDGKKLSPSEFHVKENIVSFTVDLKSRDIVGYRARHYVSELLDLRKIGVHESKKFWSPVERQPDGELILEPNSFYIIATRERVRIPVDYAAEITPYDPSTGELRSHYAGFFDPGFGCNNVDKSNGNIVVLEVRAHSAPFRLTDGQVICKMMFERMDEAPSKVYGAAIGSTYTETKIRLSKFFTDQ